jgi:hypothetical protein
MRFMNASHLQVVKKIGISSKNLSPRRYGAKPHAENPLFFALAI